MIKNYLVIAALVAAFFMGCRWSAMNYQLEISEMRLQAETDARVAVSNVRVKEQRLQAITDRHNQLLANPKTVYKTITKEVISYEQNDAVNKCVLNDDWVLLHDKAARANDNTTRSTNAANAAHRAVKDDMALMVITDNYQRCNAYKERLEAWQAWWSEVKNAY